MHKVILNAPSSTSEAEVFREEQSKNNHSKSIILILIGVIICLLIIILVLLLAPISSILSPENLSIEHNKSIIPEIRSVIIEKKKKETIIKTEEKLEPVPQATAEQPAEQIIDPDPEAIKIDKEKEEFITEQLKKEVLTKDFNNEISSTLNAIEKKQFNLARKKLQAARNIKPDEAILKELQQRINTGIKQSLISSLTKKAAKAERLEQWQNALNYYNKIIKIDADINSILVKYKRTQLYIKLNTILDNIINKPQRLQNNIVFEQAKKSLKNINHKINNLQSGLYLLQQTPKLAKKINKTESIIKKASAIVIVTIFSDNLTDIIIKKISHPGLLIEEKLTIRPGKYIIKGSRDGYKDIREELIIHSTDKHRSITIKCTELI